MFLTEVFFKYQSDQAHTTMANLSHFVNQVMEQWRYNGQIIGREIPLFYAKQGDDKGFALRVTCPEQYSLLTEFNNTPVNNALEQAENMGLILDNFQLIADDLNSDTTSENNHPSWQILYTTYLQTCSPLHNGEDFLPIPLYKLLQNTPHLSLDVIKWQENWQACDQLQMNGGVLEQSALYEISDITSHLFKHGYYLSQEIEKITGIPTFYYLYRVGGNTAQAEQQRRCPLCKQAWLLDKPLFDLFYFKCQHCRLVSNLSWNWL